MEKKHSEKQDQETKKKSEPDYKHEKRTQASKGGKVKHEKNNAIEEKETTKQTNYWIVAIVAFAILAIAGVVVYMGDIIPEKPPVQTEMGTLVLTVNGEPVYSRDIEKKTTYYRAQFGPQTTEEFVINQTVNEILLLQEAKKQNIQIDEERINDAVSSWLKRIDESITAEQLADILSQQNLSKDEFVEDTRQAYIRNFMIFELLNETVLSKLDLTQYEVSEITDKDILEEYESNKDNYLQLNVSHILICYEGTSRCTSNMTKEEAFDKINDVYSLLLEGRDFAELAKEYSVGPSNVKGGELGWIGKTSAMDPKFLDESFKLRNVNQFSKPFLTGFGYHIIKLNDKMDEFDDFKTQISIQLQFEDQMNSQNEKVKAQQETVEEYIQKLRKNAVIIDYKEKLTAGISPDPTIQTFSVSNNEVCTQDGKPIIRMFSTTWCPHCKWIKETYEEVVKEYVGKGQIVAYHWEIDIEDDALTSVKESYFPDEEKQMYQKFNPKGSIPTFVFGCKYHRIGNGYEAEGDLAKEEAEFRAVIDKLLE